MHSFFVVIIFSPLLLLPIIDSFNHDSVFILKEPIIREENPILNKLMKKLFTLVLIKKQITVSVLYLSICEKWDYLKIII